ncbi:MAG: Gfo/Idh/MocA family protein [Thermoguttaceae bacterium]
MSHQVTSRRSFLKSSSLAVASAAAVASVPLHVHAAGNETIKVGIVGTGGRGSGAALQALNADKGAKLWAVSDAFTDRANGFLAGAKEQKPDQVDVGDRVFLGLGGYKNVIDSLSPGDVVILTTPCAFRALHYDYATKRGVNVFMEKALAADIPSCNRILNANKIAEEKKLKVGVGLNNRHYPPTEETIKRIQDGAIGDVTSVHVYRMHEPFGLRPKRDGESDLEHQLRNIFCYTWTAGSWLVDAMVHNVDVGCWARNNMLPVSVMGQGGRAVRTSHDTAHDQAAYEFQFPDGIFMNVFLSQRAKTFNAFQCTVQGTKGSAVLGEGVGKPRIYEGCMPSRAKVAWEAKDGVGSDSYQIEHDRLFSAIREGRDWNEVERSINATALGIMSRMAVDSGQFVTAEEAWQSKFEFVPNVDELTLDSPAPILPNPDGSYPQPIPGETAAY